MILYAISIAESNQAIKIGLPSNLDCAVSSICHQKLLYAIEFTSQMRFSWNAERLWWILKPLRKKTRRPKPIMSAPRSARKISLVYISIAFHAKMTKNANERSDKNLSCICDDKFPTKHFFSVFKQRQFNALFCGRSWWKFLLLFYYALCVLRWTLCKCQAYWTRMATIQTAMKMRWKWKIL